jgi:hypothetical protein
VSSFICCFFTFFGKNYNDATTQRYIEIEKESRQKNALNGGIENVGARFDRAFSWVVVVNAGFHPRPLAPAAAVFNIFYDNGKILNKETTSANVFIGRCSWNLHAMSKNVCALDEKSAE